jgi:hypothetical protein
MVLAFVTLLPLQITVESQTSPFVGNWRPPRWRAKGHNLGLVLLITQDRDELLGRVQFYGPRGKDECAMLSPMVNGQILTFEVESSCIGEQLRFSMTLGKGTTPATIKGSGREILLDFKLAKQP